MKYKIYNSRFFIVLVSLIAFDLIGLKKTKNELLCYASNPGTNITEIEDNATYFFKNMYDNNKLMDIKYANYEDNSDLVLYNAHYFNNQRFTITKASDTTYYIKPFLADNKFLAIKSESNQENAKLIIRSEEYSSTAIKANRFKFHYNPTNNTFRISTESSDFTKYLSLNIITENDIDVVQKSLPSSGFNSTYEWKLIKTDNLTNNSINTINVSPYSNMYFNLSVRRSMNYIIESRTIENSLMRIYRTADSSLLAESFTNNNGYQALNYYLDKNTEYYIRFYNKSNKTLTLDLVLYPEKNVYFASYYDSELNTSSDVMSHYNNFESHGYFLNHLNNSSSNLLLNSERANGNVAINNKYFMISSHGSETGDTIVAPNKSFSASSLPNMSNVEVAIWSTCYGGKSGNAAEKSIEKGAKYAIGWPRLCFVQTSRIFTNNFWPQVLNGESVENSFNYALKKAKDSFWFFYTNIGGDSIDYLILYKIDNNDKGFNSDDAILPSYDNLVEVNHDAIRYKNEYRVIYENNNYRRYVKFINGLMSNDFYIENLLTNKLYKSKHYVNMENIDLKKEIPTQLKSNQKKLDSTIVYAEDKGIIRKLDISQVETTTSGLKSYEYVIHDLYSGLQIPFEYVLKLFN